MILSAISASLKIAADNLVVDKRGDVLDECLVALFAVVVIADQEVGKTP